MMAEEVEEGMGEIGGKFLARGGIMAMGGDEKHGDMEASAFTNNGTHHGHWRWVQYGFGEEESVRPGCQVAIVVHTGFGAPLA